MIQERYCFISSYYQGMRLCSQVSIDTLQISKDFKTNSDLFLKTFRKAVSGNDFVYCRTYQNPKGGKF